jgi:N-glycosylase/DNA lyase
MKIGFEIDPKEYNGPFNLDLTINSGQTSQPAWLMKDGYFQELLRFDNKLCLIKIQQENVEGTLNIEAETEADLELESIRTKLMDIFSLNDDLNDFYDFLRKDSELKPTIDFCSGLRLFKAHDPFECIISSISSANCSIIRWNRSIRDIKSKWGEEYKSNSNTWYTFPSPDILKNVPEHDLEEMDRCETNLPDDHSFEKNLKSCGVGYRAKFMIKTAEIVQNKINIDTIHKMSYNNAFETMLDLPGVGPKVADCILFYGFGFKEAFPVDVWIGRIVSEMYFQRKEIKPLKAREFGMKKFANRAGYVQLYMFHYARKSGLLDRIRQLNKS